MRSIDFLERAKSHIENESKEHLRYAALELRFCLEKLTYEKIKTSKHFLSEETLKTWQPPQLLKFLLEMDPNADQDMTISLGKEKVYGIPAKKMLLLGESKTFKLAWLRKHYNKLGSFLHLEASRTSRV